MCSVNLLPIDISKDSFEVQVGIKFDPSKLDYENPDKEKISKAVAKMLKKVIELYNANLVKNADGMLANMSVDNNIEWVGKAKKYYLITATKCRISLGYNIWTFQLKF